MKLLYIALPAILFFSCSDAQKTSPEKSNDFFRSFCNHPAGVDYDFLDSLTLTDYSISIPSRIDCSEIYNTQTLLSCFPELSGVLEIIEEMSQNSLSFLKDEPDPYYEYSPEGLHLFYFEIYTDVERQGESEEQVIKYSLHPRHGTMLIAAGVLAINR
tara:strand:- start:832 stop:1305 length:474 start_codon:yes stop_codon:yes gene_type:complete